MAIYRFTARGVTPGEIFNFGMHTTGAAASSPAAAAALAAALTSFWNDAVDGAKVVYPATVSIVAAHAAEIDILTRKQIDAFEVALALVGTDATTMLPHEVSVAVTTRGAAANRRDRGRFYLPPPSVDACLSGRLTAAAKTRLANASAILINSLQAAGYTPVIFHPDNTTTAIVQVDVGDVFDVQRRRRNKLLEVRTAVGV